MNAWMQAALLSVLTVTPGMSGAVETSVRPETRPIPTTVETASRQATRPSAITSEVEPQLVADTLRDFETWVGQFHHRAMAQGINSVTLGRAFHGVTYDPDVIKRDRNQSEFTKTIWDYLESAVSDTRIRNGTAALNQNMRILERIEATYGVEKEVVVAVWGLESAYGSFRGNNDVIRSLATLAFDGRRGEFFENQLIAALRILQSEDVSPRDMTGSWAGAMGHTQFMPTSYLDHAVDFTGDGKRDIWSEDPSDALASTAAYLAGFGWVKGQPWGVEVSLPDGFDYTLANRSITKTSGDWARLGVMGIDGGPVPNYGTGAILLPAGGNGAAFMVFKNFAVLERYNTADAYVIGVGHLSDRIKGGSPIQTEWPRSDRALSFKERQEMQRRLTARGFDTQGIDGKIGPNTIAAVRAFQSTNGMTPDGYASVNLLKRLR